MKDRRRARSRDSEPSEAAAGVSNPGGRQMGVILRIGILASVACLWGSGDFAQSGAINKAVGGYSFEDAAKESPATKEDGKPLTFAIINHTAGNGLFYPVYVGLQAASNAFGINL